MVTITDILILLFRLRRHRRRCHLRRAVVLTGLSLPCRANRNGQEVPMAATITSIRTEPTTTTTATIVTGATDTMTGYGKIEKRIQCNIERT